MAVSKSAPQTRDVPYNSADGNGNYVVDQADYTIWKANFGNVTSGAGGGESAKQNASSLEGRVLLPAAMAEQLIVAQATLAHPVDSTVQTLAPPITQTSSTPSQPSDTLKRTYGLQSFGLHLSSCASPPADAARDNALTAWLTSRAAGARRKWAAKDYSDLRIEPDRPDMRDRLLDAFDQAFASLAI